MKNQSTQLFDKHWALYCPYIVSLILTNLCGTYSYYPILQSRKRKHWKWTNLPKEVLDLCPWPVLFSKAQLPQASPRSSGEEHPSLYCQWPLTSISLWIMTQQRAVKRPPGHESNAWHVMWSAANQLSSLALCFPSLKWISWTKIFQNWIHMVCIYKNAIFLVFLMPWTGLCPLKIDVLKP